MCYTVFIIGMLVLNSYHLIFCEINNFNNKLKDADVWYVTKHNATVNYI